MDEIRRISRGNNKTKQENAQTKRQHIIKHKMDEIKMNIYNKHKQTKKKTRKPNHSK